VKRSLGLAQKLRDEAMHVRMRSRAARRAARRLVGVESARDPFGEIELREDVRRLLLGLAPRQRAALVLLDMYGYGSKEAARIIGARRSTVRALAAQGRAVPCAGRTGPCRAVPCFGPPAATPSMTAAREFRYQHRVLFLEPWIDIYETDGEGHVVRGHGVVQ
jgi:Sigma-70, region 4